MKITTRYRLDKVTTGTFRFRPDEASEKIVGKDAFIYLKKEVCQQNNIAPQKGFQLTIEQ